MSHPKLLHTGYGGRRDEEQTFCVLGETDDMLVNDGSETGSHLDIAQSVEESLWLLICAKGSVVLPNIVVLIASRLFHVADVTTNR